MSVFEVSFALSAVILGLALAHIAGVTHRLLHAGTRVSWAPEPILLTLIVMLVIISVWLLSWKDHNEASQSVAWTILQVFKLLILYVAAASCLPEPGDGDARIDAYDYYNRTRRLSFGALIISYLLFEMSNRFEYGWPKHITVETLRSWLMYPALYAVLILVRARWVNIALLFFALAYYAWEVVGVRVGGP